MSEARFGDLQIVEVQGRDALTWRQFRANKGEAHQGHQHTIDHITLLINGDITVAYVDRVEHYSAPASIYIDQNVEHTLTATSDNAIWLCTFLIPDGGDAKTLSMEA